MVTTSGLLPDDTGIQWGISKFGGTKPALSFLYNSSESNIQINICLFQNLILAFTISWRTALIFIGGSGWGIMISE